MVGLGSVAFHAEPLRREGQLADELPMLWVVLVYTYILIEDGPVKRFGWKLPAALFVHAIFITALATFSSGTLQFILFHASFAPPEFFSFYRIYRLHRRQTEAGHVAEGRIFRVGAACFVSGIVVWLFEMGSAKATGCRASRTGGYQTRSCTRGGTCSPRAALLSDADDGSRRGARVGRHPATVVVVRRRAVVRPRNE